jgi:hypothetical protein
LWVAGEFVRKELECNVAAEADVFRFVYHSHPAAPQFLQDAVMADGFPNHAKAKDMRGMVGWRAHEVNETAGLSQPGFDS